jgi:molybdopterin synthase catalytic subunit
LNITSAFAIVQGELAHIQMAEPSVNGSKQSTTSSILDPSNFPQTLANDTVHVELRYDPLDTTFCLKFTRSPVAGANVLFLGTTRNSFDNRPVTRLSYSAYPKLALKTLMDIAVDVQRKHGLEKVCIVHRLGEVGIEEESIAVAISSGHRGPGWKGAEEVLERVKARAEIWKREWFGDGDGKEEEGVWRANKDRDQHGNVVQTKAD